MSALTSSWIVRSAAVAVAIGGTVTGVAGLSAAAPAATTHTLKFTTTAIADHISGFYDIAANVEKHNGKVVGYDTTDCHMIVQTKKAHCAVDIARPEGTMRGTIDLDLNTGLGSGKVTGGTRAYRGATGSITGKAASHNATAVTIRYHS